MNSLFRNYFIVAALSIARQTLRAATANPAENLKRE